MAKKKLAEPELTLPEMCKELQQLQRQRAVILKSRNMQANRLQAVVAGTIGYSTKLPEKERRAKFKEASAIIKGIVEGKSAHFLAPVVKTTMVGIDAFNAMKGDLEKLMVRLAKRLPVAAWVQEREQRGFGLLFLAIVIGETGDLDLYANPGKLWRRLGCAPYTFDGKTRMGASWRSGKEGKLPAEEWEQFGYSPRRRSIAFLIGEGLVKQNLVSGDGVVVETEKGFDAGLQDDVVDGGEAASDNECRTAAVSQNGAVGAANGVAVMQPRVEGEGDGEVEAEQSSVLSFRGPYRTRYDDAKVLAKENHPDWTDLHCHRHAMLLCTKRLLKNLWIQWRKVEPARITM